MEIKKIAWNFIKKRRDIREQINFGIKPEAYNLKKISEKPLSHKFIMKFGKRLQNARHKIK